MKPGDVIGQKYRLSRRIGKGANGVVWEATNTETDATVAVKLLLPSADADQRERLLREGKACGRIDHPNVVQVTDVALDGEGEDGGSPFLVMPLLKGKTLAEAMLGKPIPLDRSVRYLRDIGRGLVAAHAADVVHRDLKPQNVFLHEEGGADDVVVKIVDFGISRINTAPSSLTGADRTLGSPQYMAPDQLLGSKVDQRADLWSFGVIAFQLFARRLPFTGGNVLATLTKVQSGDIPKLPPVSPAADAALSKLVASCLVRDLDARVQTAAECVKVLDELLETLPASPPEAASPPPPIAATEPKKALPFSASKPSDPKIPAAPKPAAKTDDDGWDALKIDAPKADAPKVDAPKVDAPKVDAPKAVGAKPAVTMAVAKVGLPTKTAAPQRTLSSMRRRLIGGKDEPEADKPAAPAPEPRKPLDSAVELDADDISVSADEPAKKAAPPKAPPAPPARSAPPKPPPKPPARDANASVDQAVSGVLADLGIGDPPPPAPIAAAKSEDDKLFEDLKIDTPDDLDPPAAASPSASGADTEASAADDKPAGEEKKLVLTETPEPVETTSPSDAASDANPDDAAAKSKDQDTEKEERDKEKEPSPFDVNVTAPAAAEGIAATVLSDVALSDASEEKAASASELKDETSASEASPMEFAQDADDIPAPPRVSRKPILIGAGAVVGVILIAVLIASMSGGSKSDPQASASAAVTTSKPAAPPPTTPAPTPTETQATPPPSATASATPSAEPSASAAPSASAPKPPVNTNWKPRPPIAQPTGI